MGGGVDGMAASGQDTARQDVTGLVVYKMTGSGNDFVMVDGRWGPGTAWPGEAIRALCDRRSGVGGDALVVVSAGDGAGRIRMTYFNSDGSRAPMCGNAALCSAQLAREVELSDGRETVLETDAGEYRVACVGRDRARLRIGRVGPPRRMPEVDLGPGEADASFVTVGVPHLVVLVDDVEAVDVGKRGRELRLHPALAPSGANVNFVALAPTPDGRWPMRTYERGVEAETYACGTGAVAAATRLARSSLDETGMRFQSRTGLAIGVEWECRGPDGGVLDGVWVEGQAQIVFRAVIDM